MREDMFITCAIASWSSLQVATINFLARSISSNDAPSGTPRSLSALSTDISNGAEESSALEPALTKLRLFCTITPLQKYGSFFNDDFIWFKFEGLWTGGREKGEPDGERRLDRTERVAAICSFCGQNGRLVWFLSVFKEREEKKSEEGSYC